MLYNLKEKMPKCPKCNNTIRIHRIRNKLRCENCEQPLSSNYTVVLGWWLVLWWLGIGIFITPIFMGKLFFALLVDIIAGLSLGYLMVIFFLKIDAGEKNRIKRIV
jgi:hypothetical protein